VKMTKIRIACMTIGSIVIGGLVFEISELIGGLFFDWVVGMAWISCFLLGRSMIRELK
jgi:hypothetical protein